MISHFTKDKSDILKGLFAIVILLSHLFNRTGIGSALGLGPVYTALGYLGVSVFLFISGYGLAISVHSRHDYLDKFLHNKILTLLKIEFVYIVLYTCIRTILTPKITIIDVLCSFLFGKTVILHGWYLQVIVLFYLVFFFVYKLVKIDSLRVFLLFLMILTYMCICRESGLSTTWYECSLCFPIGFLCYYSSSSINRTFLLLIYGVVFTSSFLLYYYYYKTSCDIYIIFKVVSSVSFSLFTIYVSYKFINNWIFSWLSEHYLEIYLVQGLAFIFLRNRFYTIENDYCFFITAIVLTIVLSYLFKLLSQKFKLYS